MKNGAEYLPLFQDAESRYDLPSAFLWALAKGESGFNPRLVMADKKGRKTGAVGLLQTVNSVIDGFNEAHGTSYTRGTMLDPEKNVDVAGWQLATIRDAYRRFVPALTVDWSSPRSVALLVQGWNSGWGALIRVAGYLRSKGRAVTVDSVRKAAREIVASGEPYGYGTLHALPADYYRHLADRSTTWAKRVATTYMRRRKDPDFQAEA
jgi:soluble lytic murein transglycosylase-like protein